jgi:hypothetical protein
MHDSRVILNALKRLMLVGLMSPSELGERRSSPQDDLDARLQMAAVKRDPILQESEMTSYRQLHEKHEPEKFPF